ncbi:MAG: hypothetical protein OSB45_14220 [Pseudomonadales bacterium]|nr:hypothetical protein [Pseudomonadales bacterium]
MQQIFSKGLAYYQFILVLNRTAGLQNIGFSHANLGAITVVKTGRMQIQSTAFSENIRRLGPSISSTTTEPPRRVGHKQKLLLFRVIRVFQKGLRLSLSITLISCTVTDFYARIHHFFIIFFRRIFKSI